MKSEILVVRKLHYSASYGTRHMARQALIIGMKEITWKELDKALEFLFKMDLLIITMDSSGPAYSLNPKRKAEILRLIHG